VSAVVTDTDIAEIYDALGQSEKAALQRERDAPDPDAPTVDGLADSIRGVLNAVPEPSALCRRLGHDADCWHSHAACLADKLWELLP